MITPDIIKQNKQELYKFNNDSISLTAKEYFLTFKNTIPSSIHFDDVNSDILNELQNFGWKMFFYEENRFKNNSDTHYFEKNNSYWVHDDNFFLRITLHSRGMKCILSLSFPFDQSEDLINIQTKFIEKFCQKKIGSKFFILIKDEFSLAVRQFKVKTPKKIDYSLNYGDGFLQVHNEIKTKLLDEDSGLFIFHGPPGCGKSTYIKKLAEEIPNKKFIYVPEHMISMMNNPETISLFIEHQNSVLVVEDAEKMICSRENNSNTIVSILLNISDGILSDILKIPVILTYNTDTDKIDTALLRKGRLKYKHEFKPLKLEYVKKLLDQEGYSKKQISKLEKENKIFDDMSLADIYFLNDEIGVIEKEVNKIKVGFGT